MKKTYDIEVDCANCANLIESEANKIDGVSSATINFMMQRLIVDFTENCDEKKVLKAIKKAGRKIHSDFEIEF